MVLQAVVLRSCDGLPLSASTDVDARSDVKAVQKYIKLIARNLEKLPDRCTLRLQEYNIHLTTLSVGLTFLMLCEDSYPTVLAFCFLDDLQREFLGCYDDRKVLESKRPYMFIEFDVYVQKLKYSYNRPKSLTTHLSVADMSTELRLRPPYEITEDDLGLTDNGILRPHRETHTPLVSSGHVLVPLQWIGMTCAGLNVFCAVLNTMRGMAFIQHGHFDDDDMGVYSHGATFILASFLYIYQVYLMFYIVRWRHLLTVLTLLFHLFCAFQVSAFRDTLQTLFYVVVAISSTFVILSRKQASQLPSYAA